MAPLLLCCLISGSGTNLQAIIDAISSGVIPDAKICLVISNKKHAFGLERAKSANIPTEYLNLIPYGKKNPSSDPSVKYSPEARKAYDEELAKLVLRAEPNVIVCAGWMHILSNAFLDPLANAGLPILNLHPALPREYDGAGAIERAFEDFQRGKIKRTGVMIHYVIQQVDRGEPIVTQEVEIRPEDSLQDLEGRMHNVEHELIIKGISVAIEKLRETQHVIM